MLGSCSILKPGWKSLVSVSFKYFLKQICPKQCCGNAVCLGFNGKSSQVHRAKIRSVHWAGPPKPFIILEAFRGIEDGLPSQESQRWGWQVLFNGRNGMRKSMEPMVSCSFECRNQRTIDQSKVGFSRQNDTAKIYQRLIPSLGFVDLWWLAWLSWTPACSAAWDEAYLFGCGCLSQLVSEGTTPPWKVSRGHTWPRSFKKNISSGWWFEPLWKIWKSIGMISNPIYGKIKFMFQTTNQSWIISHSASWVGRTLQILQDPALLSSGNQPWPWEIS